jgi:hypothetical protein
MTRRHPYFALFFAFGAAMCALTVFLLFFPGSPLDALWHLNPEARVAFESMGHWAIVLMAVVGGSCAVAAADLWKGRPRGVWLALIILSINIMGDLGNAVLRQDYRALIGLPIGGAMIFYLLRSLRRERFRTEVSR